MTPRFLHCSFAALAFTASAFAVACALSAPAWAHHTHAMYEAEKRLDLTGTVKELHWNNPHVWLYIVVTDETGVTNWSLEGGAPVVLARQGFRPEYMAPGDEIAVSIRPLKDGSRGGLIRTITFADGREFRYVSPDTD